MKVVLSRKGFDLSYGGNPSPILPPDDEGRRRMISIPIPSPVDSICYKDLKINGNKNNNENKNLYELMNELEIKIKVNRKPVDYITCHLDPDIYHFFIDRDKEWVPLFGQIDAA